MASTEQSPQKLHTYHCICTHLLLASSNPLSELPRRQPPSLDRAYIARLTPKSSPHLLPPQHVTLIGTGAFTKSEIVRREDGFEKRYLLKCGRCALDVGYRLDWAQFGAGESGKSGMGGEAGKNLDLVYLLPGGLVETEKMAKGEDGAGGVEFEGLKGGRDG
jgi:hypothetical protein